mmetsp:Transcript_9024/g.28377  ORF Transcript_9024/g.28377 Transcript_9024/m.28377 type:complete len:408 (+) Transcript_9024:49-1272(+)
MDMCSWPMCSGPATCTCAIPSCSPGCTSCVPPCAIKSACACASIGASACADMCACIIVSTDASACVETPSPAIDAGPSCTSAPPIELSSCIPTEPSPSTSPPMPAPIELSSSPVSPTTTALTICPSCCAAYRCCCAPDGPARSASALFSSTELRWSSRCRFAAASAAAAALAATDMAAALVSVPMPAMPVMADRSLTDECAGWCTPCEISQSRPDLCRATRSSRSTSLSLKLGLRYQNLRWSDLTVRVVTSSDVIFSGSMLNCGCSLMSTRTISRALSTLVTYALASLAHCLSASFSVERASSCAIFMSPTLIWWNLVHDTISRLWSTGVDDAPAGGVVRAFFFGGGGMYDTSCGLSGSAGGAEMGIRPFPRDSSISHSHRDSTSHSSCEMLCDLPTPSLIASRHAS